MSVAVGWWLNAHREPTTAGAPSVRPTGMTGTLVYAVPDGTDASRLWRWDLATGRVLRGPRVPRAIELVDARGGGTGWIGLTSELPDGRLQASVLRFLGPGDRATPILVGDLVSWGPQGAAVVAGRAGPLRPGCRRSVAIVWAKLVPALRERKYENRALCGDLLSVGLDDASTMFSLERRGNVGIYFAGGTVRTIHRVLARYEMVAVSALSDIIVVPQASLGTLAPLLGRPSADPPELRGAALQYLGSGEPRPLTYSVQGRPFAIARVLAWSPSASQALVVGQGGSQRGFYLLDTASGDGVDSPRYLGSISGVPFGTFALDSTVFVESADGVSATVDGRLMRLQLPADAPAPEGPIVWVR